MRPGSRGMRGSGDRSSRRLGKYVSSGWLLLAFLLASLLPNLAAAGTVPDASTVDSGPADSEGPHDVDGDDDLDRDEDESVEAHPVSGPDEAPTPAWRDVEQMDLLEQLILSEIPRLVSAAAFREQTPEEAPSAVIVITAADIRASGARTLGEALELCAGVDLIPGEHLLVRGVGQVNRVGGMGDAGRILLLIDGIRVNDVFSDAFTVGLARGVGDVERIELVKGPGSAMYGTSAFAGVIQVVTLRGGEGPGSEVRARISGPAEHMIEARAGGVRGALEQSVYARAKLLGPDWKGFGYLGELRGSARYNGISIEGSFSHIAGPPPQELSSEESSDEEESSSSEADDQSASDLARNAMQEGFVSLSADKTISGSFRAFARVSATGRSDKRPDVGIALSEGRVSGEGRLSYRFFRRFWMTAGLEARREAAELAMSDPEQSETAESLNFSRAVGAGYVQTEVGPFLSTTLTAGLRLEQSTPAFSGETGKVFQMMSPRVGVVSNLPGRIVLKGTFGQAFQAPSLSLLYYPSEVESVTLLSNEALEPELLRSFELEADKEIGDSLRARVNLFVNDIEDLITLTYTEQQNVLQFKNLYNAQVRGIESGLSWRPSRSTRLFGNLTLLDAYNKLDYQDLPLVPRVRFNLGGSTRLHSAVRGWLALSYEGKRSGTSGDPLSPYLELDALYRLDTRVVVSLGRGWQAALSIRNLLGNQAEDFADTQLFTTPGTEGWLELTYQPPPRRRSSTGLEDLQ